jgi:hypothetical protein
MTLKNDATCRTDLKISDQKSELVFPRTSKKVIVQTKKVLFLLFTISLGFFVRFLE